ncbi:MAG: hypothetical protein CIT01_06820 [Methanobacterium sp. BRmetb2]|nr:MAG: hypothetical protein CIT01_06820 [Methanobacterium sp. BRmetb2]
MVLDPRFYREEISNLEIEGLNLDIDSVAEALQLLVKLKKIEKTLLKINYNIRMDTRSIRKEYLKRIEELNKPVKVMKVFNKKLNKKESLKVKKKIVDERDHRIKPYELLERLINDYLLQIHDAKNYLENFIEKNVE